jgi:hypothetical protein
VREICMLRSMWRGLETESRLGLHGHEWGNPGHRQGQNLPDHRASPRPYQMLAPREAGISSGATDGYLGGRGKNALVRFAYAT